MNEYEYEYEYKMNKTYHWFKKKPMFSEKMGANLSTS